MTPSFDSDAAIMAAWMGLMATSPNPAEAKANPLRSSGMLAWLGSMGMSESIVRLKP